MEHQIYQYQHPATRQSGHIQQVSTVEGFCCTHKVCDAVSYGRGTATEFEITPYYLTDRWLFLYI